MLRSILFHNRYVLLGTVLTIVIALCGCSKNSSTSVTSKTTPATTLKTTTQITTPTTSMTSTTTPATTLTTTTQITTQTTSLTTTPSSQTTTISTTTGTTSFTINIASKALIGDYLVDGNGMTLYYTTSDRPMYSNLPDETITAWPVFYVSNIIIPVSLNASDFAVYTRDNNVKQITYKGYPLYYFFQDKSPGNTFGNKLNNVWFVVSP